MAENNTNGSTLEALSQAGCTTALAVTCTFPKKYFQAAGLDTNNVS